MRSTIPAVPRLRTARVGSERSAKFDAQLHRQALGLAVLKGLGFLLDVKVIQQPLRHRLVGLGKRVVDIGGVVLELVFQQSFAKRVFGAEVVIERALRHTRIGHALVQAHGGLPFGGHASLAYIKDSLADVGCLAGFWSVHGGMVVVCS